MSPGDGDESSERKALRSRANDGVTAAGLLPRAVLEVPKKAERASEVMRAVAVAGRAATEGAIFAVLRMDASRRMNTGEFLPPEDEKLGVEGTCGKVPLRR
jgi:hypothetical protein